MCVCVFFHCSDLGCSCHVNTSLQEVAEVPSKLAGGLGQVLGGPSGCLDHLIGRLVQTSSRLVELSLDLLEALSTGWELQVDEDDDDDHDDDGRRDMICRGGEI